MLRAPLDQPIGEELNCTDLLVGAAHALGSPCAFLEIGVSTCAATCWTSTTRRALQGEKFNLIFSDA